MPGGGEFELIARHLSGLGAPRADLLLGVGDDAALLETAGAALQVAIAGSGAHGALDPERAAGEPLAAAFAALRDAGAVPAWVTVALTLPEPDEPWVTRFAARLHRDCARAGVGVAGGDTTAGARAVTLFVTGIGAR